MFKNYLTQHLASTLERECRVVDLPSAEKHELMRCSRLMFDFFFRSQQTSDAVERSKSLFVALTYLQDCRAVLAGASGDVFPLQGRIEVLQGRFEQLFSESSKAEGGQLRMLD